MATRISALVGIWLIVSLFCNDTTNYGTIHFGINIRLDRIAYAAIIIQFLSNYRLSGRKVRWILEEKLMVAFFLILLVSCFLGGGAYAKYNRYLGKLFSFSFVPATIFMIARRLDFDPSSQRVLWKMLLIISSYLGITGLFEHWHVNALIFPKYILNPNFGLHPDRVRGPFVQAAVMGGVLTLLAFWILWYHFSVRKSSLTWVVLPPLLASIYFTNTRGVWVGFAASAMVMACFPNVLRRWIVWGGILLIVVYFSGAASKFSAYKASLFKQREAQIDDRLNIYYASWRMFCERPLVGFGYGNYEKLSDGYFAELPGVEMRGMGEGQHHTILGLMCETGLAGTIPFCAIYFLFFRTCYRLYLNSQGLDEQRRSFGVTLLAILGGNVVSMQFSDFGFYHFINDLTFWLTGLLYSMAETLPNQASALNHEFQEELAPTELPRLEDHANA